MSAVYVLEPPTKGKVVLNTNMGPIDIELWPKEAPKAVRNFVQLCLEGYYDRTIFHRVIKSFLVQGGDPTGTGTGKLPATYLCNYLSASPSPSRLCCPLLLPFIFKVLGRSGGSLTIQTLLPPCFGCRHLVVSIVVHSVRRESVGNGSLLKELAEKIFVSFSYRMWKMEARISGYTIP